MRKTVIYLWGNFPVVAAMQAFSCLHVLLVCDTDVINVCKRTLVNRILTDDTNDSSCINISLMQDVDTVEYGLTNIRQHVIDTNASVIIAFGEAFVVNLAAIVAQEHGLPLLQYSSSKQRSAKDDVILPNSGVTQTNKLVAVTLIHTCSWRDGYPASAPIKLYPEQTVIFNPTIKELSRAIQTLVGEEMMQNAYIIVLDSLVSDGFFDENADKENRYYSHHRLLVSEAVTDYELLMMLVTIQDTGYRLIFMHSTPRFFQRFVTVANTMDFFASGFAWILTENLFAHSDYGLHDLPSGLLAIEGYEVGNYDVILQEMISSVEQARVWSLEGDLSTDVLIRSIRSNKAIFKKSGSRKHVQFRLLNHVRDPESNKLTWKQVGFIKDGDLDLETVVWPGQTIFGPIGTAREHYTIVTRPAEPFVFARGPVGAAAECTASTACLQLYTYKPLEIKAAVENFRHNKRTENVTYDIYCCEGIVLDVLHNLGLDLRFDFDIYFQNDTNYGTFKNGEWTGMAGDVYNGAADMMAGAISITSGRMQAVTFTEPFYYAGFNMLSKNFDRVTSILAFLSPFETVLWTTIVASAVVVAIATSLLEWNSPFGLSPWGRRRKRNYTLGSGLTMVFSLWFGHTVSTKTPKSWPSKVLQNFWAAFSIFSIASYTANLAAYLAGSAYTDSTYSILDTKLTTKRVGVMRTSAVEEFTKSINDDLYARLNTYVSSVEEAVQKLRSNEIDLYMDDSPILEYALSKIDNNCSVKYAAHNFGENAYGFGLPKGAWLKSRIDPLLLNYVELGLVENLKWRYLGKARLCESALGLMLSGRTTQYSLNHTGGLFLVLLVAVGVSLLVLVFEHVVYFVLLPRLKKMPNNSIWKNRNIEFFSQRLYRAINTVAVKPAAKSLVQKVQKVRAKKFNLRLKSERARSVPANLNKYQNGDSTVANLAGRVALRMFARDYKHHGSDPKRCVFTICGSSLDSGLIKDTPEVNNINEITQNNNSTEACLPRNHFLRNSCPNDMFRSYDNPVFESDFEVRVSPSMAVNPNEMSPRLPDKAQKEVIPKILNFTRQYSNYQCKTKEEDIVINPVAPKTNTSFLSFRRSESNILELNSDDTQIQQVHDEDNTFNDYTENTATVSSEQMVRCRRYETWPSPKARRKSLKRSVNQPSSFSAADQRCPYCKHTDKSDNHKPILRHHINGQSDGNSPAYKDNRFKSSLRRHAMSGSHCSNTLDDSAVETLSKEDLLILWKRAEIELQTKLNRIISQNNHLRRMIDIAEEADSVSNDRLDNTQRRESFKVTKL